jgi:hypothetical protein
MPFSFIRRSLFSYLMRAFLTVTFVASMTIAPNLQAAVPGLPKPGSMVDLSSAYVPLMITGLTVHPENPLLMDFIISTGNSRLNANQVKKASDRLIKYFLASLTIPEKNQWVNLSPYEKQRIVPEDLGQTVLGQDMLTQDYILKQLTASLIYPEKNLGKNFWDKVYAKVGQEYGSIQIPVNTFNKVWILPDTAKVYEHKNTVFVIKSHLKVMLDEDYLSLEKHAITRNDVSSIGANIIRQIILPAIEQEVNTGKNFAQLRQIYHSMILAVWFKKNLREALLNQVYTNKSKVNGVNVDDPAIREKIYQQYLQAYKKGVFNYIKEDVNQSTQETIPHKYFSGGITTVTDVEPGTRNEAMAAVKAQPVENVDFVVKGLGEELFQLQGGVQVNAALKVNIYNDAKAGVLGEQSPQGALYKDGQKLAGMAFIFGTGNNGTAVDNRGNIITDHGNLLELGHKILRNKNGKWRFSKGGIPNKANGETSFEENFSGLNIARRFINNYRGDAEHLVESYYIDQNLGIINIYPYILQQFSLIEENIPSNSPLKEKQNEAVANLLKAITDRLTVEDLKEKSEKGEVFEFVNDLGDEIGRALASLFIEYINEPWVEHFIMVSGVGENFAKVKDHNDNEDIFVKAIRQGLETGLNNRRAHPKRIKAILKGLRRSTMDWKREALAARLTEKDIRDAQVSPNTEVYSIGYSIGGTKVGIALLDRRGNVVDQHNVSWAGKIRAVDTADFTRQFIRLMLDIADLMLIDKKVNKENVIKAGIAFASPVNEETGVIGENFKPINLPLLQGVNLPGEYKKAWENNPFLGIAFHGENLKLGPLFLELEKVIQPGRFHTINAIYHGKSLLTTENTASDNRVALRILAALQGVVGKAAEQLFNYKFETTEELTTIIISDAAMESDLRSYIKREGILRAIDRFGGERRFEGRGSVLRGLAELKNDLGAVVYSNHGTLTPRLAYSKVFGLGLQDHVLAVFVQGSLNQVMIDFEDEEGVAVMSGAPSPELSFKTNAAMRVSPDGWVQFKGRFLGYFLAKEFDNEEVLGVVNGLMSSLITNERFGAGETDFLSAYKNGNKILRRLVSEMPKEWGFHYFTLRQKWEMDIQYLSALESSLDKYREQLANPGGIDLNSRNLDLQSEGEKVNIAFNHALMAQFKRGDFSGLKIRILDVIPVNPMILLGLRD